MPTGDIPEIAYEEFMKLPDAEIQRIIDKSKAAIEREGSQTRLNSPECEQARQMSSLEISKERFFQLVDL